MKRICSGCGKDVNEHATHQLDIVRVLVEEDEPINEWHRDERKIPPGPYLIFAGKKWAMIGDADSIARKER